MILLFKEYKLGDMTVHYYLDNVTQNMGLILTPEGIKTFEFEEKKQQIDGLIQLKIVGDVYSGGYAGGNTMRQGPSTTDLKYKDQAYQFKNGRVEIITTLIDIRGYEVIHNLSWKNNEKTIETYTTFINKGHDDVSLEMISSFSLCGISPFLEGDSSEKIKVHRLRSVWSMEGRLETNTIEELQLEPSWAGHAIRSERFGQIGSMPANKYFPYLSIEDTENDVLWGAQLAHNASWQMEIYRKDEGIAISGGIADREFGHWVKTIKKDEIFVTPKAILSVCKGGGIDAISQRLTSALNSSVEMGPRSEQTLPIIFNEYCTTWGCPSHENISKILNAIEGKGFGYFVIDCGWYKEVDVPWDISMGDYNISPDLFPLGIEKTVELIKEKGMKPGLWFEIENVGEAAENYNNTEHLLKRDNQVLTTTMRRFWDMRDPWVQKYLSEKVISTLKTYHFEYIKIDYNDTIGIGCDGAESLGEGLRQNMEASINFIDEIAKEIPDIIIENCASGGQRQEPLMMSKTSMSSFSDAHECEEIPIIAANLHRLILPRQSQIWAVIRKEDSLKRIAYSIANTFLGRMCMSGDVLELTLEQWDMIEKGMAFYRKIVPIIKKGYTRRYGTNILSYRHPKGWQGVLRSGENGEAYLLIHTFNGGYNSTITIDMPENYEITDLYSDSDVDIRITDKKLQYSKLEDMKAVAIYLKIK